MNEFRKKAYSGSGPSVGIGNAYSGDLGIRMHGHDEFWYYLSRDIMFYALKLNLKETYF
jgi:hypothetical protein